MNITPHVAQNTTNRRARWTNGQGGIR